MRSLILMAVNKAEGTVTVLQCKGPNPTNRGIVNWKIYAIKQIFRFIRYTWAFGLSATVQVPDKPASALGTMSRDSAQILICILQAQQVKLARVFKALQLAIFVVFNVLYQPLTPCALVHVFVALF